MTDILIQGKKRLTILLISIGLSLVVLGITPEFATTGFTTIAGSDEFTVSSHKDKRLLWKIHLALQLVEHPKLNKQQVQTILNSIALSSSEFSALSSYSPDATTTADEAFGSLKQAAVRAFPKSEASDHFANVDVSKTEADILRMYFGISALPLNTRKASFRSASPTEKSNLWKTHLALFLVKRSDLSDRQKELIVSAISLATPEFFGVRSSDPAWKMKVREPSRRLEQQIMSAFAFEDATMIFATLGDDTTQAKISASMLLKSINYTPLNDSGSYEQWNHSRLARQNPVPEQNCSCSTVSDWCPIWSSCKGGGCGSTESGCGTLWDHPCNGSC